MAASSRCSIARVFFYIASRGAGTLSLDRLRRRRVGDVRRARRPARTRRAMRRLIGVRQCRATEPAALAATARPDQIDLHRQVGRWQAHVEGGRKIGDQRHAPGRIAPRHSSCRGCAPCHLRRERRSRPAPAYAPTGGSARESSWAGRDASCCSTSLSSAAGATGSGRTPPRDDARQPRVPDSDSRS